MSINVVCPGCKKRFAVSDKFAGQKGPCPSCKTVIAIPGKGDEVVIHAPDDASSPRDSTGKAILTPVLREESKLSLVGAIGIGLGIVVIFVMAAVLGRSYEGEIPLALQAAAAILLAPPLVYAGYTFLRDDGLEPFRGRELWIRVVACACAFAFIWGAYAWVQFVLELDVTAYQLMFVAPPVILIGAFASFASLDLDYLSGVIHYGMYLMVTMLLRYVAGMSPF